MTTMVAPMQVTKATALIPTDCLGQQQCTPTPCTFTGPNATCGNPLVNGNFDPNGCTCNTNSKGTICRSMPGGDPPPTLGLLGGLLAGMSTLAVDPNNSIFNFKVFLSGDAGDSFTANPAPHGAVNTYGLRHDDGTADVVIDIDFTLDDIHKTLQGNKVDITTIRATGGTGTTTVHLDAKGMGMIKAMSMAFNLEFFQNGTYTIAPMKNVNDANIQVDFTNKTFQVPKILIDNKEGVTADVTLAGRIINQPPIARTKPDQLLECTSPAGASTTLDASASSDPDSNVVLRSWALGQELGPSVATGATTATVTSPLGTTAYTFSMADQLLQTSRATTHVKVQDTTGPDLTVSIQPDCLWAPNHKMVLFELGKSIPFTVSDTCDPNPTVDIFLVTSNQPDLGGGQGNFTPDIVSGKKATCLRSEREGTVATDRIYTVRVVATDASKNKTFKDVLVTVPHDQAGQSKCPKVDPSRLVDATDPRCAAN
jgi:hypothetical protein